MRSLDLLLMRGRTLSQRAKSLANRLGASILLPQPGYVFSDSTGTTAATVDGTVACVLDASGYLGPELVTNGSFSDGSTGWTVGANIVVSAGAAHYNVPEFATSGVAQAGIVEAGKLYLFTVEISNYVSGQLQAEVPGLHSFGYFNTGNGIKQIIGKSPFTNTLKLRARPDGNVANFTIDNISVREVRLFATQATAGYQPSLRLSSGKYSVDFDGVDDNLTIPAQASGHAGCTLIRANVGAAQTTTTGVSLASGYGWNADSAGLIVLPDAAVASITAAELALLQRYANYLGGYTA